MRYVLSIFFIVIGFHLFPGQGVCQDFTEKLNFTLPAPDNKIHKNYLGLSNDDHFSLGRIKADIVIIEIFSMYCPICQREAANVNALFDLIQKNKSQMEIRLIGIGAGNSSFEVEFFKKKYTIEFPLFSDPDFSIHKKIGAVRTPHFFGLTLLGNGEFEVFYSKSGELSNPGIFLETLLKSSTLEK